MRERRLLSSLSFMLLAGCTVRASCNSGDGVDMDKARTLVSDTVEEYTKVKPTKVTCPDEAKSAKGANVVCTFEVGGFPGSMTMELADTKGTVSTFSVTGIVASAKIEEVVRAELAKQDMALSIDCGARVHPSKAGDVIACDARRDQELVGRVSVTIKDAHNSVAFTFAPVTP